MPPFWRSDAREPANLANGKCLINRHGHSNRGGGLSVVGDCNVTLWVTSVTFSILPEQPVCEILDDGKDGVRRG